MLCQAHSLPARKEAENTRNIGLEQMNAQDAGGRGRGGVKVTLLGCVSWKASWRMWPLRCVLMDEKVFDKQINGAKVSHHTNRLHSCGEHQK